MAKKKAPVKKEEEFPKLKRGDQRFVIQGPYAGLATSDGRHVKERYEVKKNVEKDGTIILALTPHKKLQSRRKELIKKISKKLAENFNAVDLMKDVLEDVTIHNLEKVETAIERGGKITPREGCFYFDIKDPRHKKPYKLPLRN